MAEADWFRVITLPGRSDFSSLNQWLADHQVKHLFTLEGDSQILWVADPELVESTRTAAIQWKKQGMGVDGTIGVARHLKPSFQLNQPFTPMTFLLLILSFLGFALVSLGQDYYPLFLFYDKVPAFAANAGPWYNLELHQYWRALTPIFLHYGWVHIIFNALWLWFLGSRVEFVYGSWALLLLVVITGLASNAAQAYVSFPIPFGGMSGVVYALFAFVWLVGLVRKHSAFALPPALFPLMVIFMVISWFGVLDWIAGAEVADTAHTVGFFSGLLCGALTLLLGKLWPTRP